MKIEGADAKLYRAVRLDTFENANKGELVSADDVTGTVIYRDTPETTKTVECGDHAIRILPR
jgi:hypothetical protein